MWICIFNMEIWFSSIFITRIMFVFREAINYHTLAKIKLPHGVIWIEWLSNTISCIVYISWKCRIRVFGYMNIKQDNQADLFWLNKRLRRIEFECFYFVANIFVLLLISTVRLCTMFLILVIHAHARRSKQITENNVNDITVSNCIS